MKELGFQTPDRHTYDRFWMSYTTNTYVHLHVMACSSALVALSTSIYTTNENTYEIEIGASGNMKTVLRDAVQGSEVTEVETPSVLSCSEWRVFWVRWSVTDSECVVQFGSGPDVDQNTILEYAFSEDKAYVIGAVSVASHPGNGAHSLWRMSAVEGMA